jgi:hypothetical protein
MLWRLLVGALVVRGRVLMVARRWIVGAATVILGAALVAAWLAGTQRSTVDWRRARAVVFESDDWGLCGFVPDREALKGLDRERLAGRLIESYWETTLEDSTTVAVLSRLLASHRGTDGLPPALQANYILCSLEYLPGGEQAGPGEGAWRDHDLPDLPAAYARPGLWEAVAAGRRLGVWRPELHGAYHYDPERRRMSVAADEEARRAAAQGVLPFPGSDRAWELGPWRGEAVLATELEHSLAVFQHLFGRPPVSVMAPDYVWDSACERRWVARGLRVIQGKREQRDPQRRGGRLRQRLEKVLERAWARIRYPDRTYLERNCRFEPVQSADAESAATRCLEEIRDAWRRGEPAVVETHRLNFVHLDPAEREQGQAALAELLRALDAVSGVHYLIDAELAQLHRSGTSWSVRGSQLVARNFTDGRRVLPVPVTAGAAAPEVIAAVQAIRAGGRELPEFLLLPPGVVLRLPIPVTLKEGGSSERGPS